MAGIATIYLDDASINKIHVYTPSSSGGGSVGATYTYTDGTTVKTFQQNVGDGTYRFEATPADGCSFFRWVYRIGSLTADVQFSSDKLLVLNSAQDIYIRAEGIPTSYNLTFELNDPTVEKIVVVEKDSNGNDFSEIYRYSADNPDRVVTLSGRKKSFTIEATPASGYTFKSWIYSRFRKDEESLTSSKNPFEYTDGVDVWFKPTTSGSTPTDISLEVYERTPETITLKVVGLDKKYNSSKRNILWECFKDSLNGTLVSQKSNELDNKISEVSYTFENLTSSTKYAFRVTISNIQGSDDVLLSCTTTTTRTPNPQMSLTSSVNGDVIHFRGDIDDINTEYATICGYTYYFNEKVISGSGVEDEVAESSWYFSNNIRVTESGNYKCVMYIRQYSKISDIQILNKSISKTVSIKAYPDCILTVTYEDRIINDGVTCVEYPVIKVSDFEQFRQDINTVRNKVNLSDYSFTSVSVGDKFSANVFNELYYAISEACDECSSGVIEVPDSVKEYKSNNKITPEYLDGLGKFIRAVRDYVYPTD